tara:strand:- start:475 stop:870 length:396 start_codon:yes stop_codon:yes gene_type:complete
MAVDYAKVHVKAVCSKNSDHSLPVTVMAPAAYTLTPDEYIHAEVQANTGTTTLDTRHLTSVTTLVIKNNDTTNYVKAQWRSAEYTGSAVLDNLLRIAPGGFLVTTDFTAANNLLLTANTAACECEVFIIGT